jgi:hypothetical protein
LERSGQQREVGHATDIEYGPVLALIAKSGAVKWRHQWRTLTSRGHIAASKVGHHIDTAQLRQKCRLVELQCVASAIKFLRAMSHRLAMYAHCGDVCRRETTALQQIVDDCGVQSR